MASAVFIISLVPSNVAKAADTPVEDQSIASVTVISGILTLDKVPNFNFATGMAGTNVNLLNNTVDNADEVDGNGAGELAVSDTRTNADGTTPGFKLTASVGNFTTASDSSLAVDDFKLTLASLPLLDKNEQNIKSGLSEFGGLADATTNPVTLTSDGTSQDVINLAKGAYAQGQMTATFNTPDSASLAIPKDASVSTDRKPKSTKYNSTITWTLTPTPKTTVTQ